MADISQHWPHLADTFFYRLFDERPESDTTDTCTSSARRTPDTSNDRVKESHARSWLRVFWKSVRYGHSTAAISRFGRQVKAYLGTSEVYSLHGELQGLECLGVQWWPRCETATCHACVRILPNVTYHRYTSPYHPIPSCPLIEDT